MSRDAHNVGIIFDWLSKHLPFPGTDLIININSGIVGSEQVNSLSPSSRYRRRRSSKKIGKPLGEVSFKNNITVKKH